MVKATNYNQSISDNIQSDESTSSQQKSIIEKQKIIIAIQNGTIAGLESTEQMSLSVGIGGIIVGILSGGVAGISEWKRRKGDKNLIDLISNGINKILNVIHDKKEEKYILKVNESMNSDFSSYLLDHTKRFVLKKYDIVNLLISLIAIFIAIVAIIMSNDLKTVDVFTILKEIGLAVLGILVFPYLVLYQILRENNEKILKIEIAIFENYNLINSKNLAGKTDILKEFHLVFITKKKKIDVLIRLLSKSNEDQTPNLNTDKNS